MPSPGDGSRRRTRCAWLIALAVLVAPACTIRRVEERRSTTPRISDDPSASRDTSLLLTAADVGAATGLKGVVSEDLANAGVFENEDPRGPCGTPVPQLPTAGGYGRGFRADGDRLRVVELVMPTSTATRSYLDAVVADTRHSCGPYTVRAANGDVHHISDVEILDLPAGCGRCVGMVMKTAVRDRATFIGFSFFESGGTSGMVQVFSVRPVPAATLRGLLDRALARL